jgi:hypothetical protein
MSASPWPHNGLVADIGQVREVPILLQKSKIGQLKKSRESLFLGFSAVRRSLAPRRRLVIDFGRNGTVPHVAARETHQRF